MDSNKLPFPAASTVDDQPSTSTQNGTMIFSNPQLGTQFIQIPANPMKNRKICEVCGQADRRPTSSFLQNIVLCEACKKFLERCQKQNKLKLRCKSGGRIGTICNLNTDRPCPKCRLDKAIQLVSKMKAANPDGRLTCPASAALLSVNHSNSSRQAAGAVNQSEIIGQNAVDPNQNRNSDLNAYFQKCTETNTIETVKKLQIKVVLLKYLKKSPNKARRAGVSPDEASSSVPAVSPKAIEYNNPLAYTQQPLMNMPPPPQGLTPLNVSTESPASHFQPQASSPYMPGLSSSNLQYSPGSWMPNSNQSNMAPIINYESETHADNRHGLYTATGSPITSQNVDETNSSNDSFLTADITGQARMAQQQPKYSFFHQSSTHPVGSFASTSTYQQPPNPQMLPISTFKQNIGSDPSQFNNIFSSYGSNRHGALDPRELFMSNAQAHANMNMMMDRQHFMQQQYQQPYPQQLQHSYTPQYYNSQRQQPMMVATLPLAPVDDVSVRNEMVLRQIMQADKQLTAKKYSCDASFLAKKGIPDEENEFWKLVSWCIHDIALANFPFASQLAGSLHGISHIDMCRLVENSYALMFYAQTGLPNRLDVVSAFGMLFTKMRHAWREIDTLMDHTREIVTAIREWKPSATEFAFLLSLIFCNSVPRNKFEYAGTVAQIEHLTEMVMSAANAHLVQIYGSNVAPIRFQQLDAIIKAVIRQREARRYALAKFYERHPRLATQTVEPVVELVCRQFRDQWREDYTAVQMDQYPPPMNYQIRRGVDTFTERIMDNM